MKTEAFRTIKKKKRTEITQVHYLDDFVDMTSHNLVGRHTQENLTVLNSDDLMCPFHCKSNIVLNTGQIGINLLLPLVS